MHIRKSVSAIIAMSLAASSFSTIPVFAATTTVEDGKIVVTSDKAEAVKVFVASYDESNRLVSLKGKEVELINGSMEIPELSANTGDKVFVWSDDGKMTPIADAFKVTDVPTAAPTAVPTAAPTAVPTAAPTAVPTAAPTAAPTDAPTAAPGDYDAIIPGDKVIEEWKFDFGTAENTMEGYTVVTPDRNVITSKDYGFIGNDGMGSYVSERYDSFDYQEGQVMNLVAGGGETDGIGIVKDETATFPQFTTGDYFPVSFGMYVDNGTYYRVRATITTLDPEKDAVASLYSERRHPVLHKETIKAGETKTVEFSVDVESIYFQKSDPVGVFVDDMLNISLLGDNAALASLVIQQVEKSENTPTIWICGDSTVTDGSASVPYFDLQNYTGVGAYISKYVPKNFAVSNQAEGGLNAADNYHFNMVKDRIKKGDYLYVEYGHNHKDDGSAGYVSYLPKYYEACTAVGANLIVVGPMERHNEDQYNAETNTWSTTLGEFSKVGKGYVDAVKYGGKTAGDTFITKYQANTEDAYSYVEGLIAEGNVVNSDIAFVDLNEYSLNWLTGVTASGSVGGVEVTNDRALSDFYFRTAQGSKSADGTHTNDAGADAHAYGFVVSADAEEYPILAPVVAEKTNGTLKTPVPVSQDIMDLGYPSNDAWPLWPSGVKAEYPVKINDITVSAEGTIEGASVTVQDSVLNMDAYGIIVITVKDSNEEIKGYFYANDQVDNSTGTGTQEIKSFRADPEGLVIGENDTYTAQVWQAKDLGGVITVDEEANQAYSSVYTPTEVDKYLIGGCLDSDYVNFNYYGATYDGATSDLTAVDTKWVYGGSSGKDLFLNQDGETKYAKISNTGSGNSWFLMRELDEAMTYTGKLMIDADIKYNSGSAATFEFSDGYKTSSPFISEAVPAFVIGENGVVTMNGTEVGQLPSYTWANIHYVLDMDAAEATMSINGSTAVTVKVDNYDSLAIPVIPQLSAFAIAGGKTTAFDFDMANLKVAKLKTKGNLPDKTIKVTTEDAKCGSVTIQESGSDTYTAEQNTMATIVATAAEGYEFAGWYIGDEAFSFTEETSVRMFKDAEITAKFTEKVYDPITYLYKEDFSKLSTEIMSDNGWQSPNNNWSINTAEGYGNYAYFTCGSGNDRSAHNLSFNVSTDSDYVFETDFMFHQSNNHVNNSFAIANGATGTTANANPTNYILKLQTNATYSQDMYINDTEAKVTIPDNTWVHILAVVHRDTDTVDVKITDGTGVLYEATGIAAAGGTDIAGVHVLSARYYSSFGLDNIKVYTADQLEAE